MQVDLQNSCSRLIAATDRATLYSQALLRSLGRIEGRVAPGVFDIGRDDFAAQGDSWILDFAEAVASGEIDGGKDEERGCDKDANLRSIFNYVNGHSDSNEIPHEPYERILGTIRENLPQVSEGLTGVNALSNLLEDTVGSVPASTDTAGLIDVSLYDYAKACACFASCAQDYLASIGKGGEDLADPFGEDMFLLLSCDISGIQSFIYNVSGSGALRQLRARSLYLELLLEVIVDELFDRLNLNRLNLQYSGGGHCYLLLPNTEYCKTVAKACLEEVGDWLLDQFETDLFLAWDWVECSAYDLMNLSQGKGYASLYRGLSRKLSDKKASRYSADVLIALNYGASTQIPGERECTECHRSDRKLNGEGKCPFCAALGEISRNLAEKDLFVVARKTPDADEPDAKSLELPFGCELLFPTWGKELVLDGSTVRVYEKNSHGCYEGSKVRLQIADYCADMGKEGISSYEKSSATLSPGRGIERLGVMRADVDNLGATFVSGIPEEKLSFSRSSVLSRSISYFFKVRLNEILEEKGYQAQIIYSGGDDLFLVGNWSDVLHAAIDIHNGFADYVGGDAITMSAGIGMFSANYPIARIADEVGELEDAAKLFSVEEAGALKTKNAIALWSADKVFGWDEFIRDVSARVDELKAVFEGNDKGSSFVYKLLDLLRNFDNVSSAPRMAYLLARSFEDAPKNTKGKINELYQWALDKDARRYFIAALEWYVYSTRKRS